MLPTQGTELTCHVLAAEWVLLPFSLGGYDLHLCEQTRVCLRIACRSSLKSSTNPEPASRSRLRLAEPLEVDGIPASVERLHSPADSRVQL